jgi:hypothetical protein
LSQLFPFINSLSKFLEEAGQTRVQIQEIRQQNQVITGKLVEIQSSLRVLSDQVLIWDLIKER